MFAAGGVRRDGPTLLVSIMRSAVVLGLFAAGCLGPRDPPISAGQPRVGIEYGTWFQGERNAVWLSYPNAELCGDDDWFCVDNPDTTMTVLSATCTGCTFVEDPTGKTRLSFVSADAIANVDGVIAIDAKLRFDATKAIAQVTASVIGDHEVALVATCALVDSALLSNDHLLVASELRDCDSAETRSTTDTVVVFPKVHSAHSGDFARFCTSLDCGGSRTVVATPPAAAWGEVANGSYSPFIVMPRLDATTTAISLSLPLATGALSTISLRVPPLGLQRSP